MTCRMAGETSSR